MNKRDEYDSHEFHADRSVRRVRKEPNLWGDYIAIRSKF